MSGENADKKKSSQPKKVAEAPPSIRPFQSTSPITIWVKNSGETLVLKPPSSSSDFWTITGDELRQRWGVESSIITQFILDYGLPVYDSITLRTFNIESHTEITGNDFLETYLREGPFNRFLFRQSDIDAYGRHYVSVIEELKERSGHINNEDGYGQDVEKKPPSVPDYIERRRTDGEIDEVIAVELYDRKGNFKLSYAQIVSALGLATGLQKNQHAALKQRGRRLCEKGEAILKKRNCHGVTAPVS